MSEANYPILLCRTCHGWMPADITTMEHKEVKIEVDIISCAVCKEVKNLFRTPKIRWVDKSWLEKKGWKIEEQSQ